MNLECLLIADDLTAFGCDTAVMSTGFSASVNGAISMPVYPALRIAWQASANGHPWNALLHIAWWKRWGMNHQFAMPPATRGSSRSAQAPEKPHASDNCANQHGKVAPQSVSKRHPDSGKAQVPTPHPLSRDNYEIPHQHGETSGNLATM